VNGVLKHPHAELELEGGERWIVVLQVQKGPLIEMRLAVVERAEYCLELRRCQEHCQNYQLNIMKQKPEECT